MRIKNEIRAVTLECIRVGGQGSVMIEPVKSLHSGD